MLPGGDFLLVVVLCVGELVDSQYIMRDWALDENEKSVSICFNLSTYQQLNILV
jgi:hypothetical protein